MDGLERMEWLAERWFRKTPEQLAEERAQRKAEREELLAALSGALDAHPNLRVGQLIVVALKGKAGVEVEGLFHVFDRTLTKALQGEATRG